MYQAKRLLQGSVQEQFSEQHLGSEPPTHLVVTRVLAVSVFFETYPRSLDLSLHPRKAPKANSTQTQALCIEHRLCRMSCNLASSKRRERSQLLQDTRTLAKH